MVERPKLYAYATKEEIFFSDEPLEDLNGGNVLTLNIRNRQPDGHAGFDLNVLQNICYNAGIDLVKSDDRKRT